MCIRTKVVSIFAIISSLPSTGIGAVFQKAMCTRMMYFMCKLLSWVELTTAPSENHKAKCSLSVVD